MLPTGDKTTAVPVQKTSSAPSSSSTVTWRSSTCKLDGTVGNGVIEEHILYPGHADKLKDTETEGPVQFILVNTTKVTS